MAETVCPGSASLGENMFALLASVAFLLVAFGVATLGPISLLPLGLALFALHFIVPVGPVWARREGR